MKNGESNSVIINPSLLRPAVLRALLSDFSDAGCQEKEEREEAMSPPPERNQRTGGVD